MDEFTNENLKSIFNKLKDYESDVSGISWIDLESRLATPTQVLPAKPFKAILSLILVFSSLFLCQNSSDMEHVNVQLGSLVFSGIDSSGQVPMQLVDVIEEVDKSENPISVSALENITLPGDQRPPQDATFIAEEIEHSFYDVNVSEVISESAIIEAGIDEDDKETVKDTVSEMNLWQEDIPVSSKKAKSRVSYSLGGIYFFGIAEPNQSDNILIRKYTSMPGLGFSGAISFPMTELRHNPLYMKVGYKLLSKEFNFERLIFAPEEIYSDIYRQREIAHYLGAGMEFTWNSFWKVEGSLYYPLNKSGTLTTSMVDISARKQIREYPLGIVWLGLTGSFRLRSADNELNYIPIQLSITLSSRRH